MKKCHLRKLSLVKVKKSIWKAAFNDSNEYKLAYPFYNDMPLIFLGEIPNMREHGIFIGYKSGHVYSGYHIFNFEELKENEL